MYDGKKTTHDFCSFVLSIRKDSKIYQNKSSIIRINICNMILVLTTSCTPILYPAPSRMGTNETQCDWNPDIGFKIYLQSYVPIHVIGKNEKVKYVII